MANNEKYLTMFQFKRGIFPFHQPSQFFLTISQFRHMKLIISTNFFYLDKTCSLLFFVHFRCKILNRFIIDFFSTLLVKF